MQKTEIALPAPSHEPASEYLRRLIHPRALERIYAGAQERNSDHKKQSDYVMGKLFMELCFAGMVKEVKRMGARYEVLPPRATMAYMYRNLPKGIVEGRIGDLRYAKLTLMDGVILEDNQATKFLAYRSKFERFKWRDICAEFEEDREVLRTVSDPDAATMIFVFPLNVVVTADDLSAINLDEDEPVSIRNLSLTRGKLYGLTSGFLNSYVPRDTSPLVTTSSIDT